LPDAPTNAQFIKVYGPKGPKMTWDQRAKAGVDAKHFQEARSRRNPEMSEKGQAVGPQKRLRAASHFEQDQCALCTKAEHIMDMVSS